VNLQRAVVALAVVGICRIAFFHFISEPRREPRREAIDPRYQQLRALLPAAGEVGYVSDLPAAIRIGDDAANPGTRLYLHAQYALAPLVLRYGDVRAPRVVANVSDPARLDAVARENHLEVLARAAPGTAILRPR
jgi:hypothetical protein